MDQRESGIEAELVRNDKFDQKWRVGGFFLNWLSRIHAKTGLSRPNKVGGRKAVKQGQVTGAWLQLIKEIVFVTLCIFNVFQGFHSLKHVTLVSPELPQSHNYLMKPTGLNSLWTLHLFIFFFFFLSLSYAFNWQKFVPWTFSFQNPHRVLKHDYHLVWLKQFSALTLCKAPC